MIKVTVFSDKQEIKGFEVCGHAGFSESGNDIICAAVSVLAQNTANSIEEFTHDDFETELDEDIGRLKLMLTDNVSSESQLLMKSFELGINSIINDGNSNYIKIRYKEV
ncbi:MAG: ribosomal-processing cysteine protease Prp [Lachnospiraceae bacterium]|nr:ribosomal-processing cysteine protease Prp [Lachnospiraceae bacterium]